MSPIKVFSHPEEEGEDTDLILNHRIEEAEVMIFLPWCFLPVIPGDLCNDPNLMLIKANEIRMPDNIGRMEMMIHK
jgi:hypothetical protein